MKAANFPCYIELKQCIDPAYNYLNSFILPEDPQPIDKLGDSSSGANESFNRLDRN